MQVGFGLSSMPIWSIPTIHYPKKLNKALKKTCNQEPIKSNLDPSTKKRRKNTTTKKRKLQNSQKFEHSTPEKKMINNQEPIQSKN